MTIEELEQISSNHPIIFYDGVCILCNRSVQFIINKEPSSQFRFVMLQSDIGKKVLQKIERPIHDIETTILIDKGKYYTESDVGILASKYLRWPYKMFYIFRVIPKFIRDPIYRVVAKNRYNWFGKDESCLIPSEKINRQLLY